MVVRTDERKDGTIPIITVGLDGANTSIRKKFKCSVCGGTVFSYFDTLHILLPIDINTPPEYERFIEPGEALDEVECTHFIKNNSGRRVRCRTMYLLMRPTHG